MYVKEIEFFTKHFSTEEAPGTDDFDPVIYQTLKEEITLILHKLFEKVEKEGKLLNLFYEESITLRPKYNKISLEKKNTDQYPHEIDTKFLKKI